MISIRKGRPILKKRTTKVLKEGKNHQTDTVQIFTQRNSDGYNTSNLNKKQFKLSQNENKEVHEKDRERET